MNAEQAKQYLEDELFHLQNLRDKSKSPARLLNLISNLWGVCRVWMRCKNRIWSWPQNSGVSCELRQFMQRWNGLKPVIMVIVRFVMRT